MLSGLKNVADPEANGPIRGDPRRCPVCADSAAVMIFENRMAPCAGYDFSTPILSCASCDAAYAGYGLQAHDLNRYYSTLSKYDTLTSRSGISTIDRERVALAMDFLAPNLDSTRSVLDVGCSTGVLLHALHEAGVEHVCGIDPSADAPAVARSLFDVSVTQAEAETYEDYGKYDLVCLMAVLEHLLEPRPLLHEVGRQLKPGGRVLIEIPDAGAFDRPGDSGSFEPFGEFSNEHINFLSIADVRRLGASAGLRVERWKTARLANGSPDLFVLLTRAAAAPELPAPDAGSSSSRSSSGESVRHYVARSKAAMQDIERRLAAPCRGAVLIYGAGNHTGRLLLQSPGLAHADVLAVFDRNPHLHGASIGGHPILSPSRLGDFPEAPVIISTFNARHEIRAALLAATSQPLILLYD
jgi:SAM-dependent methyltransferase